MQFNSINFPDELIASLRASKCVVFAGAGISRGKPASLPDFNELANLVADGSGEKRNENELADRFLGRIFRNGVAVHKRVSDLLNLPHGRFTPLHTNLVRLFSTRNSVRIVTTNYDSLFEEAATALFGESPEIYRSPALPLGSDFSGIVHVHGHLDHIKGMVVTDADFGRGYLTEGWARRFLVDLFRTYTVLFIGYSHEDIVLEYLSRALPESAVGQRFALIGEDVEQGEWLARGIKPISFTKPSELDYSVLNNAIKQLSDYLSRTILDWKRELTALAAVKPPQDEESDHQIIDALSDKMKVRFFTNTATDKDWLSWLDSRGVLNNLFLDDRLDDRDLVLANWLAKNYVFQFPNELIFVIANHGLKINYHFWLILGQEIGMDKESSDYLSPEALSKWISVLLSTYPSVTDDFVIGELGRRCSEAGNSNCLIELFIKLVECHLEVKKGTNWLEG
ncbi:MAG: SIR2 family protein [Candidatus Thiodiazotropha sp.]